MKRVDYLAATLALVAVSIPLFGRNAEATHCADVECGDLNASGGVTASDALRLLRKAIGVDLELACPATCSDNTTTTSTTTTTTTTTTSTTTTSTTTTTVMSGTTTTTIPRGLCTITFRLADDVNLVATHIEVDYSGASGVFTGEGKDVNCEPVAPSFAIVDDDAVDILSAVFYVGTSALPFNAPTDLMVCEFDGFVPDAAQFSITVRDTIRPGEDLGMAGSGVCGAPVTGLMPPTFRDNLFTLAVGVGQPRPCDLCECDTDNSGTVTPVDALRVGNAALHISTDLNCPPCGYPVEVRGGGDPVSVVISDIDCF